MAVKANASFEKFRNKVKPLMVASDCVVKAAIAEEAKRLKPERITWANWLEEFRNNEELDLGDFNWPSDVSAAMSTMLQGKGHKDWAALVYYILHYHLEKPKHAEAVDNIAFDGETYSKKFDVHVFVKVVDELPRSSEILSLKHPPAVHESDPATDDGGETVRLEAPQPKLSLRTADRRFHYSQTQVDVLGRQAEQAELKAFLECEKSFCWFQIAGAGGQGKSRLAYDLAKSCGEDWNAGFINAGDLNAFSAHWERWQPEKPTLIIVDYVWAALEPLKSALQTLGGRGDLACPVRLLIVERQRWDRGGTSKKQNREGEDFKLEISAGEGYAEWFLALFENEGEVERLLQTCFEKQVRELTNLSSDDLVKIVRQVANLEHGSIALVDGIIKEHLERIDKSGRPLFAHLLGAALAVGTFKNGWTRDDLMREIIKRDQRHRWKVAFEDRPSKLGYPRIGENILPMRLATLATMIDGLDCGALVEHPGWDDVDETAVLAATVLNDGPRGERVTVASAIPSLQPDILGEWFVLESLSGFIHLAKFAGLAWQIAPKQMAAFLERCARDFPEHHKTFELLDYWPEQEVGQKAYASVSPVVLGAFGVKEGKFYPETLFQALALGKSLHDGPAIDTMAYCYYVGVRFEQNHETAFQLWYEAALLGHASSQYNLVKCYIQGIGTEANTAKAFEWLRKLADAGDGPAMYELARAYDTGNGVVRNRAEALVWLHKAADAGISSAMHRLFRIYDDGDGVAQNSKQAYEWFRKACDRQKQWRGV